MRETCPCCEEEVEFEGVHGREEFEVRGESVVVEVCFRRCPECGEEFEDRDSADPFEAAYREYRRRHGFLQPEELRALRERTGLTASEAALILGLSPDVLAGYEGGMVQSGEHDLIIRRLSEPECLLSEGAEARSEEARRMFDKLCEHVRKGSTDAGPSGPAVSCE